MVDLAVLEVMLDGNPVQLRASRASVRQVVGIAYLLGGFDLVVALHHQVRARVEMEKLTLNQLQRATQRLSQMETSKPNVKAASDRALSEQMAQIPPTERRLKTARDVLNFLHEAWSRIALAEEQVLCEYEPKVIGQFAKLATQARTLALKEWGRYVPYDTTETDLPSLNTSEAKKRLKNLKLRNEGAVLIEGIRELYKSWKEYLDALRSTETMIRSFGPGRVPSKSQVMNSRSFAADKFKAFNKRRSDIGGKFPVALQVYGRIGKKAMSNLTTTDSMIECWVIESLIDAVESAQNLAYEAWKNPLFKEGERLRVEAADADSAWDLPAYQQSILAEGLTIPASRIIANRLADSDASAKSPWFQLPVRLSLFRRGVEGDETLAPYATPGRLHHAALSEVNTALQEVRRKEKEAVDQALLLMDAIALPAGFFTSGATVAAAGAIHAIVRGKEMYISIKEYQAQDELAQIVLVPMQQSMWEQPSAVALTGKLIEGGFEIASDLVTRGIAGSVLDAIQISLTIGYGAKAVAEWVMGDDLLESAP
jgi:hypothetical protein